MGIVEFEEVIDKKVVGGLVDVDVVVVVINDDGGNDSGNEIDVLDEKFEGGLR